jgi:hypothetical protein
MLNRQAVLPVIDAESVFDRWQQSGCTVAFYRVGIGVSMAFTGKIFKAPLGVWTVGGRHGGSSFDARRATSRQADLPVPDTLLEVVGARTANGIELLLETGEQCFLWRVPTRT